MCVCVYFLGLGIFYDEEAARLASTQTSSGEHVNSSILALLQLKQGQHFDQLIAQLAKSVGIFKKKNPLFIFLCCKNGRRRNLPVHDCLFTSLETAQDGLKT